MQIGLWIQSQGRVQAVVSYRSESTTSRVGRKGKRLSRFLQRIVRLEDVVKDRGLVYD